MRLYAIVLHSNSCTRTHTHAHKRERKREREKNTHTQALNTIQTHMHWATPFNFPNRQKKSAPIIYIINVWHWGKRRVHAHAFRLTILRTQAILIGKSSDFQCVQRMALSISVPLGTTDYASFPFQMHNKMLANRIASPHLGVYCIQTAFAKSPDFVFA